MASAIIFINARIVAVMKWCRLSDSNGRPTDYKSVALPAELKRQRLPFTITIPQRSSPLCMLSRLSVRRATNNADRGHVFASMRPSQIGIAHVCTPLTNAQLDCRLQLEKKKLELPQHISKQKNKHNK